MECEAVGRVGLGWAPKAQHSKNDEVLQPLSAIRNCYDIV